ncbi:MAG: hypothetical protein JO227_17200 [Acetobacteraceae bacterium]|nr:hypothetical protein [Acetobacteraceae bacterium]
MPRNKAIMPRRHPPVLDMLPNGTFREPVRPSLATRIFIWAVVVAVIAGSLAAAAVALWIALLLIPVALAAAVVAWLAFRFQAWRAGRAAASATRDTGPAG